MRPRVVTDTDIALLRSLAREPSVVAASRSVGLTRDRAVYRIAQLQRAFGGPLVTSVRGGRAHGGTRLTPLGDRIVREGFDSVELLDSRPLSPPPPSNWVRGIYHEAPAPGIAVGGGIRFRVAFRAQEGETVTVMLDPEAILVARGRFVSSARNVVRARVQRVMARPGPLESGLVVRAGSAQLRVAVTRDAVRQLRLRRGALVWLYVKATALRRVGRVPVTRAAAHPAAPKAAGRDDPSSR